jgi:tetratricopeptide (TPR) repeat protein
MPENMAYRTPEADLKAWLEAGLAAHRRGEIEQALAAYRQLLVLSPDYAPALNLLGTGLLQLGSPAEAIPYLERAARRQRGDPRLLSNLAQAYLGAMRYGDAVGAFRQASRLDPQEPQFQVGTAAALALNGQLADAQTLLRRLTGRFPATAGVWFNLGNVLRDQRQPVEAIAAYEKALTLDPAFLDARNNVGSVLHSMQRFAEAERNYRACLEADPRHRAAVYNLASVLIDVGRFREGEALCRELVAAEPDEPNAHAFLGAAVGQQGRLLEALQSQERAARLDSGGVRAAASYGAALTETGHAGPGFRWLAAAAAKDPAADGVRQLMSTALLAQGCLHDGWREYARRPAALRLREKYPQLDVATVLPAEFPVGVVCVLREQGLGDEIFLLRYASVLAQRGPRVVYRASAKIASLIARAPFVSEVLPETGPVPAADAIFLVGDLPFALSDTPVSAIPAPVGERRAVIREFPYRISIYWPPVPPSIAIAPLDDHVLQIRERLQALGPPPYIAVTWRGGTLPEEQSSVAWMLYKEVPLEGLAETLGGAAGTFLAVQRKPAPGEIERFSAALGRPLHDLTALNEDLEAMHALLSEIDEYIGVSNTNMHLRAAVGKTARVLVPAPAEWRWMQGDRESVWFPGFTTYRQSLNGGWEAALAKLARDLSAVAPASQPAGAASDEAPAP